MADRVWKQLLVRIVEHTSVDNGSWQRIGYGAASGNGAAGGTTVVASGFISGSADAYNGRYWIEMLDGTCQGQWKRIVDDDGSGTYTLENNGFSAQIDSGDTFAIWKSPEPVIVCDGDTLSTTQFNDDYRDEDDEKWVGYWVMPISGDLRGEIKQISAFDAAGGASEGLFTVGAFSSAPKTGDVFLIGKFIEVAVDTLPGGPEYLPRPVGRVNYAMGPGTVGARGTDFAITARVHGSGSLAAASATANACELSPIARAAGLAERIGTSSAVGAGSTTTDVSVDSGSWENHQIGDIVMYNGNARRITALTDGDAGVDTVTVAPPLPVAPVAGGVLHAMRTYYKDTDASALYGATIEVEIDGVRTIMTGCKGTVETAFTTPIELSFTFQCDNFTREYEDAPYNPGVAYTTQSDILGKDMMAWADTTQVDVKGLTASVGRETVARAVSGAYGVNGRAGFHHMDYACGATYQEIMADDAELEAENRYLSGTDRAIFVQCGAGSNCLAFAMPVAHHIDGATPTNGDGLVEAPNVLGAMDAGVGTDPDGTITKVPDWALAIS